MHYAALVLTKATTDDPASAPLFEETVLLVHAESSDEARAKAEGIARGRLASYRNPDGRLVTWSLERIVDVAPTIHDPAMDGAEVYARHFESYDDYARFEPLVRKAPAVRDEEGEAHDDEAGK